MLNRVKLDLVIDGDYIRVAEKGDLVFYKVLKISNNSSAYCEGPDGKKRWFDTSLDTNIVGAFREA